MPRLVQVFAVDQRQEFRVVEIVLPGEAHEARDRLCRGELVEHQPLLGPADIGPRLFENGREQAFLAPEVMIDHALVDLRPLGDGIDPGAREAAAGEFKLGGGEEPALQLLRVADGRFPSRRHYNFRKSTLWMI